MQAQGTVEVYNDQILDELIKDKTRNDKRKTNKMRGLGKALVGLKSPKSISGFTSTFCTGFGDTMADTSFFETEQSNLQLTEDSVKRIRKIKNLQKQWGTMRQKDMQLIKEKNEFLNDRADEHCHLTIKTLIDHKKQLEESRNSLVLGQISQGLWSVLCFEICFWRSFEEFW